MSRFEAIHGALILGLSLATGCMCESSVRIGPGGTQVDFQGCPPREVRSAVDDFETALRKRPPSPDDARIRAEAFTLLGRVQRLVDQPSNARTPDETRQQVAAALARLRALPDAKF